MITDGAANFHDAFKKEFFTINNPRTGHISHIRLQGDHNNDKMERMNGEVRDREKVMRIGYSCSKGLSNIPQLFQTTYGDWLPRCQEL
ncbi:MAG: hypothetical protein WAM42_11690 [Candidatus Nitrosopolaris sp.]|jgi:hypothetical protein